MANSCRAKWCRTFSERGACMHKVPQRRIKVYTTLFISMIAVFLLTVIVCVSVFLFLKLKPIVIISPIATLAHHANPTNALNQVQDNCLQIHLQCQQALILPDGNIHFVTDSGTEVFLSTQKDIKKQLASLQAV